VTKTGADSVALLKRFDLVGPPGFAFFGKDGREMTELRLNGYIAPEAFLSQLKRARG
jgi:thioredoxin:protein disulfide reductase